SGRPARSGCRGRSRRRGRQGRRTGPAGAARAAGPASGGRRGRRERDGAGPRRPGPEAGHRRVRHRTRLEEDRMTPTTATPPADGVRALFVHAYPDDEAITTGGTIAALVAAGADVRVVTCTLGEEGEVLGEELAGLVADRA